MPFQTLSGVHFSRIFAKARDVAKRYEFGAESLERRTTHSEKVYLKGLLSIVCAV